MGIHQISRDRMIHAIHENQLLKTGQIIQGKILKLYPNNKAQIQLGSQIMIAQLEAALAVGERYHFQVEAGDELIHLKVIGEHLKTQSQTNITDLLRALQLKVNKGNIDFVQNLINERIPFSRAHLTQSFSLLENIKNNAAAQEILKEMIIQRLPITESVFQALVAKNTTEFSSRLKTIIQQLEQQQNPSDLQLNLLNRLRQMIGIPQTNQLKVITQIIAEANSNNQEFFNALKIAGLIDQNIEYSSWKSQWLSFSNQHHSAIVNSSDHHYLQSNLPFPINLNAVEQALNQVMNSQTSLSEQSRDIVSNWSSIINETVIKNTILSERNFEHFKNEITQKILPILSNQQRGILMEKLENNPAQLRQFLTMIQQFTFQHTYTNIEQILSKITEYEPSNIILPQVKFLEQIRQMLQFSGITDENLLSQDIIAGQSNQTVKSMLIQMLQQDDNVGNERVQQLLHHINGLQLQSVQEVGSFIQASLVVPGEKLFLNKDIYIEFESKKTEDGKINPEFCRILFYLDLANLRETIIDMQIQKRIVSITVFNNHKTLKVLAEQFQPSLKEKLESLNYQLTNITIKSLEDRNKEKQNPLSIQLSNNSYEGIEFRI